MGVCRGGLGFRVRVRVRARLRAGIRVRYFFSRFDRDAELRVTGGA